MSRTIKIKGHLIPVLDELSDEDLTKFVDKILTLYLKGILVHVENIAGRYKLDKVYRKNSAEIADVFDETSHDFKGVVVIGRKESESIFIPSIKLHDALRTHDEILVINSPRKKGISTKETEEHYYKVDKDTLL